MTAAAKSTDIIAENWDTIKRLVKTYVPNPDHQDDVLQDALLKVLTTTATHKPEENVVSWFSRIIKNTAIDLYRKTNRYDEVAKQFASEPKWTEDKPQDVCACVLKLMQSLSKTDQYLLKALELDGIPTAKVAKKLGISLATLKVRRHRARMRLKNTVTACCGPKAKGSDCSC